MNRPTNDQLLTGGVLGLILVVTVAVVAKAFWPTSTTASIPTPTPSPEIAKVVEVTPSPIALFSPSPVVTASPKASISPSPSVKPSVSPTPSTSPKPSPSPTPTPSPSPTPAPAADVTIADDLAFTSSAGWSTNVFNDHNIKRPSSETFTIETVNVRNQGKVQTENIEVRFVIDGQNQAVKVLSEKIDPNTTNHFSTHQTLPNAVGHHTIQVQLNPDHKVTESDYGNNSISFDYTVE